MRNICSRANGPQARLVDEATHRAPMRPELRSVVWINVVAVMAIVLAGIAWAGSL